MNKINKKLIFTFAILTFIFGLSLASPLYARTVQVDSGAYFSPYDNYSTQYQYTQYQPNYTYPNNNYYNNGYNNLTVIPGCEGRTVGFSTISGQSCYGNYVNNPIQVYTPAVATNTTNTNNTETRSSNIASTSNNSTTSNSSKTSTNNNKNTSNASSNTSDINPNYGSLTSNALFGSNSFMPSGLAQWIFLAIIIVAIIFLWRYVHAKDKYMIEPLKHA